MIIKVLFNVKNYRLHVGSLEIPLNLYTPLCGADSYLMDETGRQGTDLFTVDDFMHDEDACKTCLKIIKNQRCDYDH